MPKPREIELKLELDESDAAKLKARLLRLGAAPRGTQNLLSTYFDTAKHHLRSAGLTLRVRAADGRRVQTIKANTGKGVGLFDRAEWETSVADDRPDLEAAADTPVRAILDRTSKPLMPAFEVRVDRQIWSLQTGEAEIEITLDAGQVVADAATEPLIELELELKRGTAADLFDILQRLGELSSLRLGVLTKSERGYRLLDGTAIRAVKAEPVMLERGSTTAAAFQAIMRACIRQFRLNEPLVVATRQAESLHQLRVAMRRLRSALSLFKSVVADEALEGLASRLREVSFELGEARNLDVFLDGSVRPEAERGPAEPGAAAFLVQIEKRRTAAYNRILRTLRSKAFRQLMFELLAWVEAGPWLLTNDSPRQALRDRPIEAFAAEHCGALRRKIKKRGRHLDRIEPEERHRIRIKAKKLRYAAEFFAALVRGKTRRHRHTAFVEALTDLQEQLGELNDIQTAHTIVNDLARGAEPPPNGNPETLLAAGYTAGMRDARADHYLHAAKMAHRTFADAKPFWSS